MVDNKIIGDATPFNKLKANEIRSKLLVLSDKECNRNLQAQTHKRNHFLINSKAPEELKVKTIFYIQLDNEDYSEASDLSHLRKLSSKTTKLPVSKPPRMSISLQTMPSSYKSTKSLKESPKASDKSDEEITTSPQAKDKNRSISNILRSPNMIKYITPLELKINKSSKQAIKMKTMASFNYLQSKASDLTVFKKLITKSSRKGSSQAKLSRLDTDITGPPIICRSTKKSETIKESSNIIIAQNLINQFSLLKASLKNQNKTDTLSTKKFERSPKKKFNTIKSEVIILKPESPLKTALFNSPKKGCLRKNSNSILKYKESITEIDGE